MIPHKSLFRTVLLFFLLFQSCVHSKKVVWQPSHQTDTGKDFSEAAVCNGIITAAMAASPKLKEYKVWSLGKEEYHHADSGSNTKIEHTTAILDGKISGYAYELREANKKHPFVFIAVHNNGGTKRHAIWGYIHYGDKYEQENRELAARLVKAICSVSDLENRGVLLDSTTGRNDYRCQSTGKLSFYSLDENINTAPYRVLLEVGDNAASHEFLLNPNNQKKMGEALKKEIVASLAEKKNDSMLTPNFHPFPELSTERLLLRQIRNEDAKELFVFRSDKRIMQYIDRPLAQTIDDALQLIQKIHDALAMNDGITWGISLKNDPLLIGTIGYWRIVKEHYRAEIGYLISLEQQGKGLMQEAIDAAVRYGFNEMQLHSIEANVNPNNAASIKLLERNHFIKEAHFKENYFFNGVFHDTFIYSLLSPR